MTDRDASLYNAGVMLLVIGVLAALIFYCSSCCYVCRNQRSCFPACPPPVAVAVSQPCVLPPKPDLPDVATLRSKDTCPLPLTCFDAQNAKLLALRLSRMKIWIKESLAACPQAKLPVKPTSQPASAPTR